ncbi:MAG: hypothetical protein EZS28_030274 [Streblomastix strix]|uniref:Uncharacterized protein n=1 Tax=Streblomastix strix TaxID=222440 RepID=A0A5J4UUW3_9EUKA|nr:MAG: hypothetical protein EZS28_030274 [Streblomastix strix]
MWGTLHILITTSDQGDGARFITVNPKKPAETEDDDEEDEYDSDADHQALNDQSVPYKGYDSSRFEFQSLVNRGGYDGKSGDFGGRNEVGYQSESDEEEDDEIESLFSNA